MNLALALKNVINKFRNNGSDNLTGNESGIIIPEWLNKRKISDNDASFLINFFNAFDICYFSEITADDINSFGSNSYENVIKICNLLGLYGVKFLGRNANKYSPNSSNRDLIVKSNDSLDSIYNLKFTNSHIDIVLNRENEIKIFNFLKSENIVTINQLNGLHLGVLSDKLSINLELTEKLFKNSGLGIIGYSKEELFDFYNNKKQTISNNENHKDITESINNNAIDSTNYMDFYYLFDTRVANFLKRNGIKTLEHIMNLTEEELLSFENSGHKTVQHILDKLHSNEFNEILKNNNTKIIQKTVKQSKEQESFNINNINYVDFYYLFSTRTENVLKANNINTIEQLKSFNEEQILTFKNSGQKTVKEIFEQLDSDELIELYEEEKNLKQIYSKIITKEEFDYNAGGYTKGEILNTKICLPINTKDILKRKNINTIGDIIQFEENEIKSLTRTLDDQSFKKIKNLLNYFGLSFGFSIQYNPEEEYADSILNKKICLSLRTNNLLKRHNINKIGDLIQFKEISIKNLKGLGDGSFKEIVNLIENYNLHFANYYEDNINNASFDKDLDERYLYNLFEKFELSESTKAILTSLKIRNVGQLLEIFPTKFFGEDNCLTNNITEVEDLLKELGFTKYPIKFSFWEKEKLNELTLNEILQIDLTEKLIYIFNKLEAFVDEKNINFKKVYEGRFKSIKRRTLEEIGTELGVSRERIRQIEGRQVERQLKRIFGHEIKTFQNIINNLFNEFGTIISINFVGKTNIENYFSLIDKFINENSSINFKINYENELIIRSNYRLEDIYENVTTKLSNEYFDKEISKYSLDDLFSKELDLIIKNDTAQQNENFVQVSNILLNKFINEYLIKFDDENFKLKSNKSHLNENIAYHFKDLYPTGEYVYQKEKEIIGKLTERIPELKNYTNRAIIVRLVNYSGALLLWGKGFYIHKDNINPNWLIVDESISRIIELFDNGIADPKVDKLYYEREKEYIDSYIPDSRALYSVLRLKNDPRLILDEWPRIFDSLKGRDKRELIDVFTDYIKEIGGVVSREELRKYFCEDRGWKNYELDQTFARAFDVVRVGSDFIHVDNLEFNIQELENIAEIIQQTIESRDNAIHLRKIQEDYKATWYSVCQRDIPPESMGFLLSKQTNFAFKIERKVYAKPLTDEETSIGSETTSIKLLSDWMYVETQKQKTLTNGQIYEFCEQHGLNRWSAISTIRKAGMLEYYKGSFVHPEVIGYTDEFLEDLILLAEQAAKVTYETKLPYIKFELLKSLNEGLPLLNEGYEWTDKLLESVLSKLDTLQVFSGAFIFKENPFNVEDLDDVAAFILANSYSADIIKLKELDKILSQEDIIEYKTINSYKQELFAEGSSIELVDDGNNVILSKIGRERYLNV